MLNQKVWLGFLALHGVFLSAFEYQISARVGSFSRIAFNQSVINSKKRDLPYRELCNHYRGFAS
ncbi:outer membrane protein [Helicobacter pylori 10700]|nr:outer membrane protein [Helicobacter pylori 10700]